ncbi:hypothetical protein Ddye_007958, partial [Dipteronia dyeriana]
MEALVIHRGLNMVSWVILMLIGVITTSPPKPLKGSAPARYMKVSTNPIWFYALILCQSLAYAFGIAGAVAELYLGGKSQGNQFDVHRYIGITLLIPSFLQ